jgi:hypothetical protein
MDTETSEITWTSALEKMLAEEGEKALGLSWLHNRCEEHFGQRNNWISIPVIVLSTLVGAASASANQFFPGQPQITGLGIGSISILTGVLSTVNSYFAFAKRTEAHRLADIHFQKVYRFIAVELTLPRIERIRAKDMLKIVRDQIERLSETSPPIPHFICENFKAHFAKEDPTVARPDITSGLRRITITKVLDESTTTSPLVIRKVIEEGMKNREPIIDEKIVLSNIIIDQTNTKP